MNVQDVCVDGNMRGERILTKMCVRAREKEKEKEKKREKKKKNEITSQKEERN